MHKPFLIAKLIAWISTLGTIILSLFSGIKEIFGGPKSFYDPNVAILSVTLITIIWYTYWTHLSVIIPKIEDQKKSESSRKALATALLTELQRIDQILRDIYNGGIYTYNPIPNTMLNYAGNNLHVFSNKTIKQIAYFQNKIDDFHKMLISHISKSKIDGDYFKLKAVLACDSLNLLVDSLMEEGGTMPETIKFVESYHGSFPPLPDKKFDEPVRL